MSERLRKIWESANLNSQSVTIMGERERDKLFRELQAYILSTTPKDGYTPVKGKDYFDGKTPTRAELLSLIKELQPTEKELLSIIKKLQPTKAELADLVRSFVPTKEELIDAIRSYIPEKTEPLSEKELRKLIVPLIEDIKQGLPKEESLKPTDSQLRSIIDPIMRQMVAEAKKGWFGGGGGGDLVGAGTGITITTNNIGRKIISTDGSGSGGGHVIQEDGVSLTQRAKLNFLGSVAVADNAGDDSTDVTVTKQKTTLNNLQSRYEDIEFVDGNKQTANLINSAALPHGSTLANEKIFITTRQSPARLVRINDLDDVSDQTSITFASDGKHNNADSIVYVPSVNKLYVLFGVAGRATISEVDPDTLAVTDVVDTTDYSSGTSGAIETDGTHIFVVTSTSPTLVVKYKIGNWSSPTSNTLTGLNGGHSLIYDGVRLSVTGATSIFPSWIATIDPADLSYNSLNLDSESNGITDDHAETPDFYFVGTEFSEYGNIVYRVRKDLAGYDKIRIATPGSIYAVYYDGNWVWVAVAPGGEQLGRLVRLDPMSLEMSVGTLDSGQVLPNEIISDGKGRYYITTFTNPGTIIKLANPSLQQRRQALVREEIEDEDYDFGVSDTEHAAFVELTAPRTVYLPDARFSGPGLIIYVSDETGAAGSNNIVISGMDDGFGNIQQINNAVDTITLDEDYGMIFFTSDGANWYSHFVKGESFGGNGGGVTILTATGTIDDSNLLFSFSEKPTEIVVNGASYTENNGWTWSAPNATLETNPGPVGTGGRIYGRK